MRPLARMTWPMAAGRSAPSSGAHRLAELSMSGMESRSLHQRPTADLAGYFAQS